MAEDMHIDALSWSVFIDRLAGPLRLEPPERQAFGLLMTLHLVAEIWGDIALMRGAEQLSTRHHFDLDRVCAAGDALHLRVWYRQLLDRAMHETPLEPLPKGLLQPAWTAERKSP